MLCNNFKLFFLIHMSPVAYKLTKLDPTSHWMISQSTDIMTKHKELSEDLRLRIVNAHKDGKGYKAIFKQFQVPTATVQSIIRKFKAVHTVKNLKGRGRESKVSP